MIAAGTIIDMTGGHGSGNQAGGTLISGRGQDFQLDKSPGAVPKGGAPGAGVGQGGVEYLPDGSFEGLFTTQCGHAIHEQIGLPGLGDRLSKKAEQAARAYVEYILRTTGQLPKWEELLASDPRFAAAVRAESERGGPARTSSWRRSRRGATASR
jgi:hypothetical protein